MSCVITYKGNKYTQEQFKEYISSNKNEFSHIIASNKNVIDSFKRKMEGIDYVFSQSPELASIGSKAQYLQYLSTIFKTSKVKNIVYHRTDQVVRLFDENDVDKQIKEILDKEEKEGILPILSTEKEFSRYARGIKLYEELTKGKYKLSFDKFQRYIKSSLAFYFTEDKETKNIGDVNGIVFPFIINIKNPRVINDKDYYITAPYEKEDSIIMGENPSWYVVFDPEQIHVLGGKADIEGFKEFIENKSDSVTDLKQSQNVSIEEIAEQLIAQETQNTKSVTEESKNTRAIELANKMSSALGIEYEIITEAEAKELTKNTSNPWNGEPAFFVSGKVYFIQERLSSDMVMHEFSHPLIRAIARENQELFESLYNQLSQTPEGQAIIQEVLKNYPHLKFDSLFFKEEVLVKALQKAGVDKLNNLALQTGFEKVINNILYHLKQLLRRIFGKNISISGLNANTSLNTLAEILSTGTKIKIETELVSDEDIVAYNKEIYEELTKDVMNIRNKDVQDTINTFYDIVNDHIQFLLNNHNYEELAKILMDEYERGDLQAMRANLKAYQTSIKNKAEDFLAEAKQFKDQATALTNTLFRLEQVISKIYQHLQEIPKTDTSPETVGHFMYYKRLLDHWDKFIKDFEKSAFTKENNVAKRSSLASLLADIKADINNSKTIIDNQYLEASIETLYTELEPLNRTVSARYEELMKNYRDRQAKGDDSPLLRRRLNSLFMEYYGMSEKDYIEYLELVAASKTGSLNLDDETRLNELQGLRSKGLSLDKDKLRAILKGQAGDAHWFNSYLEGYMYNTDPIVGGLALYVKNKMSDVLVKAQQKYSDFAADIQEDLKAAGFNPMRLGRLGEEIGFKDKVARYDRKTGEWKEHLVWTFLNPFKNYRYEQQILKKAVEAAHLKWQKNNTEENKQAFLRELAKQKKFQRTYMNQEYVAEYYKKQELLEKDDIGIAAAAARDEIIERIRILTESNNTELDQIGISDELDILWREYRQLHSRYDLNGNLKTGDDFKIAERLRQYREASKEFFEFRPRRGVFENAYQNYLQELRVIRKLQEGEPEWIAAIEDWKKKNTRSVIKQEFYDERLKILNKIKEILNKLPDSARKEIDQSRIWEQILEQTAPFKDDNRQINASEMSEGAIAKIKDLLEELEVIKKSGTLRNGLEKTESAELERLLRLKSKRKLTPQETVALQNLFNKRNANSLNGADIAALNGLYKDLAEMSTREASDYYLDIMNNWLSKLNTDALFREYGIRTLDKDNAHFILDDNIIHGLLKQNADFEKWFNNNHIIKEKFDQDIKEMVPRYERLYVWDVIKPTDPEMMESYKIDDDVTVEGLPAMKYYARVVKQEYRTPNILGITKDNQGNFLPKSREEMSKNTTLPESEKYIFINEEYEKLAASKDKEALFRVLEKIKKHHLQNQEGLGYGSRLYLDFPRLRKSNLEILRTASLKNKAKGKVNGLTLLIKRLRDFVKGGVDDDIDGTGNYNRKEEDSINIMGDRKANFNLVKADLFDNEITDIPIAGLYDLDADDVSTDITSTVMRYMLSAERQKQLVKISPMANAIRETVNNPDNAVKNLNSMNKRAYLTKSIVKYLPKKENVRRAAINNFMAREFEGETQKGITNKSWLNNFTNFLFKRASFAFFAFNIPSALKNSFGMKFQAMIQAAGGKYVDIPNLALGEIWATETMRRITTTQIYTRGPKDKQIQIMEAFDMVQGRLEEQGGIKFGQEISRTLLKDAASMSVFFSFRKWVEIQAALQLNSAMLYKVKVVQHNESGTKELAYLNAFEVINGKLQLKKGIDVRYNTLPTTYQIEASDTLETIAAKHYIPNSEINTVLGKYDLDKIRETLQDIEDDRMYYLEEAQIKYASNPEKLAQVTEALNKKYDAQIASKGSIVIDNTEFKLMRNRMHQVSNNLSGAYAKFDQPEAQRYLAFRVVSYMRRYFTTMAIDRLGFSGNLFRPRARANPGLSDTHMGFYVQFINTLMRTVFTFGKHLKYARKEEKVAAIRFFTEMLQLYIVSLLCGLLGWDPDDEDRFAKLREKSGPLPFPGVEQDLDRPFHLDGYLEVHLMHLLMQIRAENEQFNPFMGGIKQYTSILDTKSVALGPTIDSYQQVLSDTKAIITGSPKARYTRKIGPYNWQDQDSHKLWNRMGKTLGLTGTSLDPALAIQNFQSFQAKARR